jgi:hypothetical protein
MGRPSAYAAPFWAKKFGDDEFRYVVMAVRHDGGTS